jgi:hypothetical protein
MTTTDIKVQAHFMFRLNLAGLGRTVEVIAQNVDEARRIALVGLTKQQRVSVRRIELLEQRQL